MPLTKRNRNATAAKRTSPTKVGSHLESTPLSRSGQEAVAHLQAAVTAGEGWPLALLEAMGMWTATEEVLEGQHYCYLIQGEAFNWPLLGRRLLQEVDGQIPVIQREQLLGGDFPLELSRHVIRRLLGVEKYRAFLNYWYGVMVEEALQKAVEADVRKARVSRGFSPGGQVNEEVFQQIYDEPRSVLLARFQAVERETPSEETSEFTYWLFKLRLSQSNKERVASDTRKGLEWLDRTMDRTVPARA